MAARLVVVGPNSSSVNYQPNTPVAEIFALLHSAVLAGGWSLFDDISSTSKVYRAPMADSATVFKYVQLTLTPTLLTLLVYESWNATTHVGLNLAWLSDSTDYAQRVDMSTGGSLFMFIHARWLVAFSRITDPTGKFIYGAVLRNAWSGCFEIQKENSGEVTGTFPRFAWVNGSLMAGSLQTPGAPSVTPGLNASFYHYSMPRMRNGSTSQTASMSCVMTNITAPIVNHVGVVTAGSCSGSGSESITVNGAENTLASAAFPSLNSPFSASKAPLVVTPYAYDIVSGLRGAFFGLKLTSSASGSIIDKLDIKVDANFRPSIFGVATSHVLLGVTLATLDRVAIPI